MLVAFGVLCDVSVQASCLAAFVPAPCRIGGALKRPRCHLGQVTRANLVAGRRNAGRCQLTAHLADDDRNGQSRSPSHNHSHKNSQSHDHSHDHGRHHSHLDDEASTRPIATGDRSRLQDHSHAGHSHTHMHLHLDADSLRQALRSKRTILRLVLASICVLALPLWRRSSRLEVAAVGLVAAFLGVVEVGKVAVDQARIQLSEVYRGWRSHSRAASIFNQPSHKLQKAQNAETDAVTWAGVGVNVCLAAFKIFAGIAGHSAAMIADAGHSLSDLLSDGVTLWAVKMSRLPPDDDHPYGHGRFEAVGAFVISLMLLAAGYGIGNHSYEILQQMASGAAVLSLGGHGHGHSHGHAPAPTYLAVIAALVSIVLKEGLYQVTASVGKRQNSQVLIANAWHHRSDAISSVVALLAILGAMMGAPILDPVAGLLVAGMVSLTGLQVCWDSLKQLTDTVDYEVRRRVAEATKEVEGVVSYDNIRARQMGRQTLVDLTIQTGDRISASSAQQVAQRVRWNILEKMPTVSDVLVNVAVEEKPCPVMSSLRPQSEIEQDIRQVLRDLPEIMDVPKIMVHYINMATSADVFIRVDPKLRVHEVTQIAHRARTILRDRVTDLNADAPVDVHLDLLEAY